MKRQAAELGGALAAGTGLVELARLVDLVPAEWGPWGTLLAAASWGAVQLVRRIVAPLDELVKQGEALDARLSDVATGIDEIRDWQTSTEIRRQATLAAIARHREASADG